MTKKELQAKLARLESINDQLITEVEQIDHLMRYVGFEEGWHGVKATAQELTEEAAETDGYSEAA